MVSWYHFTEICFNVRLLQFQFCYYFTKKRFKLGGRCINLPRSSGGFLYLVVFFRRITQSSITAQHAMRLFVNILWPLVIKPVSAVWHRITICSRSSYYSRYKSSTSLLCNWTVSLNAALKQPIKSFREGHLPWPVNSNLKKLQHKAVTFASLTNNIAERS